MHYIDKKTINDFTDTIIEFPALQILDDNIKDNFKDLLGDFFNELYVNKMDSIKTYLQFRFDDNMTGQILRDYGIDPKLDSNINPIFKKEIVYFIERLFQKKGSVEILQYFNKIFESLFSAINFYRIIVVKQPVTKTNDDGTKTIDYRLSYALEPLYINDKNNTIKVLDQKVSMTGKFLMDLNQFKDFKVFPVNTNLVYMQFTSVEVNLNNTNVFETAVRAYALTDLNQRIIPFRNFYGKYFDVDAADLPHILFYLETYRMKLKNDKFDFSLNPNKAYLSLKMNKDNLYELNSFLYEYKNLKFHDRKEMNNFKRRWNSFKKSYYTTERLYHNYNELETFINDNYPEIIEIKNFFLTNDDAFIQFYIEMYLVVIANINIEDKYTNLYINSLFLSHITGESFLEHFFLPVYKVFQKYFFPIEMDFLAKIMQTFIVKDKFEGISYDQKIAMSFDTKAMSKRYLKPDLINLYLTVFKKNTRYSNDDIFTQVVSYSTDSVINKNKLFLLINSDIKDKVLFNKNIDLTINTFQLDNSKSNDKEFLTINTDNSDNLGYDKKLSLEIDVSQSSKQKLNEEINTDINTLSLSYVNYNEKKLSVIDRYDYTEKYDDLKTYLIFNDLIQTKASDLSNLNSYLTNTNFKYNRADDQIYFSVHNIFK